MTQKKLRVPAVRQPQRPSEVPGQVNRSVAPSVAIARGEIAGQPIYEGSCGVVGRGGDDDRSTTIIG
jgi:hypothetical protein